MRNKSKTVRVTSAPTAEHCVKFCGSETKKGRKDSAREDENAFLCSFVRQQNPQQSVLEAKVRRSPTISVLWQLNPISSTKSSVRGQWLRFPLRLEQQRFPSLYSNPWFLRSLLCWP
ncbi:hypothetical protein MKW98_016785 [Papaver atlanticum]|uniref:Uncharacterized protein n=1 Tax=Papaver atlanticum TaxID=357466 RepID=A0AAD4TLE6_9MAGN|nr:hypothetical protein MKW98_016785 [Papaver atlanticum]